MIDIVPAPKGSFGPTFFEECIEAGLQGLPFVVSSENVIFSETIDPSDRAKVMAVVEAHDPTKPLVNHATECTPAQGQMALYKAGHYDAFVQAVTNSNDVPLKIYAQSALKWELNNPHIQDMKTALGLSDSDVQSLFDLAVTL